MVKLHKNINQIPIRRDVRQGDTSPKLFITVLESAFKHLDWSHRGININGENLTNLRFADDIVLISDNLGEMKLMLQDLQRVCTRAGLNINVSKTKFMTNLVPSQNINIDGNEIEKWTVIHILAMKFEFQEIIKRAN